MKNYRVFTSNGNYDIKAIDEKDALFQVDSQYGIAKEYVSSIREFIEPIKPAFVRVHLGFVTVNLRPDVANDLGYKEGDRFKDESSMYAAIATQNVMIVEEWYKRFDVEMPTNFAEAVEYMIKKTNNFTENVEN